MHKHKFTAYEGDNFMALVTTKEMFKKAYDGGDADVYKRQITDMAAIPAHIARGILQSSAMQRTIGTHKI